jgi:hypothetical protein
MRPATGAFLRWEVDCSIEFSPSRCWFYFSAFHLSLCPSSHLWAVIPGNQWNNSSWPAQIDLMDDRGSTDRKGYITINWSGGSRARQRRNNNALDPSMADLAPKHNNQQQLPSFLIVVANEWSWSRRGVGIANLIAIIILCSISN